jgi:arsenate reductase
MKLYTKIDELISTLDVETISEKRKETVQPLIGFIQSKVNDRQEIRITFICSHNSRRSHLAQVWAQTLAAYFDIENVVCYSGGTEATEMVPMIAKTFRNSGFEVKIISKEENPVYSIKYGENEHPVIGFSKKLNDGFNPKSEFAAVMVCSQADKNCPFVAGAELRIPIPYEDPKVFDNTPQQAEKYKEANLRIANEMHYVFSKIHSQ